MDKLNQQFTFYNESKINKYQNDKHSLNHTPKDNMMDMELIPNNIYQNDIDYQYGNSNNMIRSRSQSSTSDSNLTNNNIIIKPNKTSNNTSHSGSSNNISQSSHVLTSFDYPLSNPTSSNKRK